jgi:hypothetical protein
MIEDYSKMLLGTLQSIAESCSFRLPNQQAAERLGKVRDELKRRRIKAQQTLKDIENLEQVIYSHIFFNRRKRILSQPEKQLFIRNNNGKV